MKRMKTLSLLLMVMVLPLLLGCSKNDSDETMSTPTYEKLLCGTWVLQEKSYYDERGRKIWQINKSSGVKIEGSWVLNLKKDHNGLSYYSDAEDLIEIPNPEDIIWALNNDILHVSNWYCDMVFNIKDLTETSLILKYRTNPTLKPGAEKYGFYVDSEDRTKYNYIFVRNDSYEFGVHTGK